MVKLVLIGGESALKRDARQINEQAIEEAGEAPIVLVFPWAKPSFDRNYGRRRRFFDYLRSLGAAEVAFAEYSETSGDLAKQIACASLVYLTGGQASILITRLRAKSVDVLLGEYKGVIVGRSAGALALAKKCVVKDRYSGATRMVDGLALADLCLKVHYKPADDVVLRKLSMRETIYALPQASALICDGYVLSCTGDLYIFKNGEKQLFNK